MAVMRMQFVVAVSENDVIGRRNQLPWRLSADLRRHGFRFTGPVTAYATMQACGLVDDHLADCFCRG